MWRRIREFSSHAINEYYASTSSESSYIKEEHELEEHAAFQLHKAVVRHGFRKIRLHRTLNEEQVVVLEIAECTEMKIQQNGNDFTVGQRRLTTSTLGSAIVFYITWQSIYILLEHLL